VVSLGRLDVGLLVRRHRGVHELLKGFEDETLLILVEDEEPIPVDRLKNQVIRWQSTKLKNFQHLIIVILSWENRCFNK
jgi:hypothetical protein